MAPPDSDKKETKSHKPDKGRSSSNNAATQRDSKKGAASKSKGKSKGKK